MVDENRLAIKFIMLNVGTIVTIVVTLFCIIWACLRPDQYFC